MKIYNSIEDFAKTGCESQVALGFFDGVHLGHRTVIADCVDHKEDRKAVVLTFSDSPARLLGNREVSLITDNARKAELMAALGVDAVIFEDFLKIKDMDAEAFIICVLKEQLRAKKVSCGFNYRFGKAGRGDTDTLKQQCGAYGISVSVKAPVVLEGKEVSSSTVRDMLQRGEIETANRMLGCTYGIRGNIGEGNHIGTAMGFPTVNLPVQKGSVVPRFGVYASRMIVGGKTYRGATNIGVHPTVKENDVPLCETFLLDYNGEDLRGAFAECELERFIRPEQKFSSLDELQTQVSQDIETIKSIKT